MSANYLGRRMRDEIKKLCNDRDCFLLDDAGYLILASSEDDEKHVNIHLRKNFA